METTVGKLLVNQALPPELRDPSRELNKKEIGRLYTELASKYPEQFDEITRRLQEIARDVAYKQGGFSFKLSDLKPPPSAYRLREQLDRRIEQILDNPRWTQEQKEEKILEVTAKLHEKYADKIYQELLKRGNPFALQVYSGARGNKAQLARLLGGDLIYSDHRDHPIPFPVLRSFSEGLSPAEWFASAFGARKGLIGVKFCLDADTTVRLPSGRAKAIHRLVPGDRILSYDPEKDETVTVEVRHVFDNGTQPCFWYVFECLDTSLPSLSVMATEGHEVLALVESQPKMIPIRDISPIPANGIEATPLLAFVDGAWRKYYRVYRTDMGPRLVYDIEVDHPSHAFFLHNGALVGNSTPEAGTMGKQMAQAAHRLVVVDVDGDDSPEFVGLPVDIDDPDNEGALLAMPVAGYKRNTVLTPKVLEDIRESGVKKILVRSPTVGGPETGVYARDVGIYDKGKLPDIGEQMGLTGALELSEGLTQGAISAKHSGGMRGSESRVSGYKLVNQLIQVPKNFRGGAAHAEVDGRVEKIEEAPTGGYYVWIRGQQHYVPPGQKVTVSQGQAIEAGDTLSDGLPNPAKIVEHKGIGEGRRYLVSALREAYQAAGMPYTRRNLELLARGLVDHVEFEEESGDFFPGDVVSANYLFRRWKPRQGSMKLAPKQAVGKYLERPVLHYTVGTKIRPSMLKEFEQFGVKQVEAHPDPPPFRPVMIRAMANLQNDPDWLTRMFGAGQKKSLLSAAHYGGTSDMGSTSFVPAAVAGRPFKPSPHLPDDRNPQSEPSQPTQRKRFSILDKWKA